VSCSQCHGDARFVDHRTRRVLTLCGHVTLTRAYYHCASCQQGDSPADTTLQLAGRYSRAVQQLVTLAGTLEAFRDGEALLKRLAALNVTDEQCRQFTERVGEQLVTEPPPVPAPERAWDFSIPSRDGQHWTQTVAYVGMDAFAVPVLRPDRTREFKMLYVGLLYEPRKEHTVYLTNFDHEQLAKELRTTAIQCGYARASQVVGLSDAGNGFERVLQQEFGGGITTIVDFWHAAERLHQVANTWYGVGSGAAQDWAHAAKGVLRSQGGTKFLTWLEQRRPAADATPALHEVWQELHTYVTNQQQRMDYPLYVAQGWDIGSGPTEAGCKCVGSRLKRSGMKWYSGNVAAVARVRALYLSNEGLWDDLWSSAFTLAT
jgi:hypothetical protein